MDTSELRRLLEAATPLPWALGKFPDEIVCPNARDGIASAYRVSCLRDGEENAPLIVAAVNALPALLDRLAVLEEVAEAAGAFFRASDESRYIDALESYADVRAALARLDGEASDE